MAITIMYRIRRRDPSRSWAWLPQNRLKIIFLCIRSLIPCENVREPVRVRTLDRIDISPAGLSAEEIHSDANDNLLESGKVRSSILLLLKRRYCSVIKMMDPVVSGWS